MKTFVIENYKCVCVPTPEALATTFMIYPEIVPFNDEWIEKMALDLNISLVMVYVPADQWNDALTPWPEPGEAKGCPPFAGKASDFLKILQNKIVPTVKQKCNIPEQSPCDLVGVSLGGLFTLWQWMICDTFRNIACLSGSFWYVDFIQWFRKQTIPAKTGKAFFLLGEEEPLSHVEAFKSVGVNTEEIVNSLKEKGIKVTFDWVPGNHFSRPVHRATLALTSLYIS